MARGDLDMAVGDGRAAGDGSLGGDASSRPHASQWSLATSSVDETIEAGRLLARVAEPNDVVILSGDLGAGKTQLAKGVALGLGSSGVVTSPTFNIVLVYDGGRLALYHFDLYRLDDADELDDIDYFGLLEDGGLSVVEWGEKFPDDMPCEYVGVEMRVEYPLAEQGDGEDCAPACIDADAGDSAAIGGDAPAIRHIKVSGHGERGAELAEAWGAAVRQSDSLRAAVRQGTLTGEADGETEFEGDADGDGESCPEAAAKAAIEVEPKPKPDAAQEPKPSAAQEGGEP